MNQACQLNPGNVNIQLAYGHVFLESDHMIGAIGAIDAFEKVLDLDSEFHAAHLYTGMALREMGDFDKASREFEAYRTAAGEELSDLEQRRLASMVDALKNGYLTTPDRALDQIREQIPSQLGPEVGSLISSRSMTREAP